MFTGLCKGTRFREGSSFCFWKDWATQPRQGRRVVDVEVPRLLKGPAASVLLAGFKNRVFRGLYLSFHVSNPCFDHNILHTRFSHPPQWRETRIRIHLAWSPLCCPSVRSVPPWVTKSCQKSLFLMPDISFLSVCSNADFTCHRLAPRPWPFPRRGPRPPPRPALPLPFRPAPVGPSRGRGPRDQT